MERFLTKRTGGIGVAAALAALVVGAAGGTAAALLAGGGGDPAGTAEVVKTDLTMKASGTLGYDGSYTVGIPSGVGAVQVAQAQHAVTQDQQNLAGDEQAESDAAAAEQSAGPSAADQQTAKTSHDQAQDKVLSDQAKLAGDQSILASLQASATSPGTVYTWLPMAGQVIHQNQRVYTVSAQPVPLLYGGTPAYRAFYPGMSGGPDVHQLNGDLAALGFGSRQLAESSDYSRETVSAVKAWQTQHGLPATGQIPLGGVVFEPGPVRVTSVAPSVGESVRSAGGTVLTATGTIPVVTASLAADQQNLVKPGDAVSVALPDGTAAGGQVRNIGDTTATITLDSTPAQAVPGQAPVTVTFDARADHVLAVPANALLTLPGGGYGVDVVTGGDKLRLDEVAVGLRSNTQVQVSGSGIKDGTTVAVPSTLGQQPGR